MGCLWSSTYRRIEADLGGSGLHSVSADETRRPARDYGDSQVPGLRSRKATTQKIQKSLRAELVHGEHKEGYETANKKILDPRGPIIRLWSKIFLVACLFSIFIDPLFFYIPIIRPEVCIDVAVSLETILNILRSIADIFYWIHIVVKLHTAIVTPFARVIGKEELVKESSKIALNYLRGGFWLDLVAALPLPQVLTWVIIPNLEGLAVSKTKALIWFILLLQYIPRIYLVFPLSSQILEAAGVVTQKAWTGAAYNLFLFMLIGHAAGACWYILSMERQEKCWISACNLEKPNCQYAFFDCQTLQDPSRIQWFKSSNLTDQCNPNNNLFPFGIYNLAVINNVQGSAFVPKYFYCLWWGLKNLSTLGQSFTTSIDVGENVFVLILLILGLLLLALLIGNMQRFLQSTTIKLEEWKIKRTDTEHWMYRRHLPPDLRQFVRKYDLFKWLATRGVDEESIIKGFPDDLRRKIKRHVSIELIRQVPLFDQMDETTLDAICERLQPAFFTKGMFLVCEGDPVNQMFFIIRGQLESYTTNGGRTGFFNSSRIGPGDFCGDELLTWALDPQPGSILPSSTRTVKAIIEVEAFALIADDLKFVAAQFRRLHSRQIQHKFRFYSHQWRTWAACTIQAAWHRYKRLKKLAAMGARELGLPTPESFWSKYAERLVASTRGNIRSIEKPPEPDFLVDWE